MKTMPQDLHSVEERIESLDAYWRVANYLGAAQLYLKNNALMRRPLTHADCKPRPLGHWGTQPGLNLIYAHLNRLIKDTGAKILLVVGPGHGAPAILANFYLEGTLQHYDPKLTLDARGADALVRRFSWPGGSASHLTAETPGTIHEGGELGYSLAHAYGAAFDNRDLIVACVVGDGEAETGPLAAAWHSNKFLNPVTDGVVLPILHLNGYKLSGPSIYARMTNEELLQLFRGFGYEPAIVDAHFSGAMHARMWEALDGAYSAIRRIQAGGEPRWPMILLRSPKGVTGPAVVDGKQNAGTTRSHGLPFSDPATNPEHFELLKTWLESYEPRELFDAAGAPNDRVTGILPDEALRIGRNPHANGGELLRPLELPEPQRYATAVSRRGSPEISATSKLGEFLAEVVRANAAGANFRFFCPDETTSNKLDAIFSATDRAFMMPLKPDDEHLGKNGRVMEILSEHDCEGWLEGYLLTGRHGMFACYEGFISIVDSMVHQYAKWLKMSHETPWRAPIGSLNFLLTSHVWRQDHNGYSHQGPGFVNALLTNKSETIRMYFPADANALLSVADHCLRSRDYINLIVAAKNAMPQWQNYDEASNHCKKGMGIWEWAGNESETPDVVLTACGDVPTLEALAAAKLLRERVPSLRLRFVNVVDLMTFPSPADHPHGASAERFEQLFGDELPVVMAFHGYPRVIHELIYHRPNAERFHVRGYEEEGTTTTPFDMVVRNRISRYHLAIETIRRSHNASKDAANTIVYCERQLERHGSYINEHGEDMPEIRDWRWQ